MISELTPHFVRKIFDEAMSRPLHGDLDRLDPVLRKLEKGWYVGLSINK